MPLCLAAAGSVRTRKKPQSATCAMLVHTFWPLSTYAVAVEHRARLEIGEIAARVRLGEALAPDLLGGEDPVQVARPSARRVPCFMRVGPSMESPLRLSGCGACARDISS